MELTTLLQLDLLGILILILLYAYKCWLRPIPTSVNTDLPVFLFAIERINKQGICVNFMYTEQHGLEVEMSTFYTDAVGRQSHKRNSFFYPVLSKITGSDLLLQAENLFMEAK